MLRPYSTACLWLYLLYCFWQCLHTFVVFLLNLTSGTFFPLDFTTKCHLHVCVYCMQFLPWWFNNDFWEIECSEVVSEGNFLALQKDARKIVFLLPRKPTDASEVDEREVSQSSSTEEPPGQSLGSKDRGAAGVGGRNQGHKVRCKLVVRLGRCLQIPEASQLLPRARAGPALLFIRIQRRESATDGSGRRHRGAFDGSSQRSSGGHR